MKDRLPPVGVGLGIHDDALAREGERGRPVRASDGHPPRHLGLLRVAGAKQAEIGNGAQGRQVLDGLVGRAVLPHEHRVMGEHVDHRQLRDGGNAHRGAHVIGEHHERGAEGPQASVIGNAVADGGHAVLPDAEMEVPAQGVRPAEVPHVLEIRAVRTARGPRSRRRGEAPPWRWRSGPGRLPRGWRGCHRP